MRQFLSSYAYFVIPWIAWVVAQIMKLLIMGLRHKDWNWRYMYRSGGMPSSHTAVIVALCTVLAFREGTTSASFGIACTMAAIVMYDAMNVRHVVGEHSEALKAILPTVFKGKVPAEIIIRKSDGHTLAEVGVGTIIGVVLPILLYFVVK